MANQPKTRTRRTLGGGEKTVTRSKYTDAAGTKVRERKVTKEVPSESGVSNVTKTTTKRKFASGQTSKRKVQSVERANAGASKNRISGLERVSLGPSKITSVKEKVSGRGVVNKAKGLMTAADKYGYSGTGVSAKSLNYRSAKGMQKAIKKGYKKS
jgi:hypothetical protein